jgi:hypothetical protein
MRDSDRLSLHRDTAEIDQHRSVKRHRKGQYREIHHVCDVKVTSGQVSFAAAIISE